MRTAIVTGPICFGALVNSTPCRSQSLELRLEIVDLECRRRNPLLEQGLLIRACRRIRIRLERQLRVAAVSGAHGQPAKLAHWNVARLHEAQDLGVETQCLGLIVDEYRAELDSHGVFAGFVTRWTLAARPRCASRKVRWFRPGRGHERQAMRRELRGAARARRSVHKPRPITHRRFAAAVAEQPAEAAETREPDGHAHLASPRGSVVASSHRARSRRAQIRV